MIRPHSFDGGSAGRSGSRVRTLLSRYRVERTLGQGGMGEVMLALDELLNRRVALKRMSPAGADRATLRKAILREARRASQINHPRIAGIHDVIEVDDDVLLVMEYVDGITLRRRLEHPVPLEEFWSLAFQCVEGIAAAHAQGVIHRDIKPENLMVTGDGQVKILDFGIARRAEAVAGTMTGTDSMARVVAGTPQYMAPEAHLGGTVDERTDLFALGVVFYELLTGTRPFDGATYAVIVDRVLNTPPAAVRELNPAVGPELSGIVAKLLARNPDERFPSAADLMRELEAARRGAGADGTTVPIQFPSPAKARSPDRSAPAAAPRRRSVRAFAVASLVALAVAAAAVLVWRTAFRVALPADRNLALLPPRTPEGDDELSSFALGFTESIASRLEKLGNTPGFQIASFKEGFDENVRSARDARQVLGANLALVPTVEQGPELVRARLDLLDTSRDRLIASRTIERPRSQLFLFLDETYRSAAAMLKLEPDGMDAASEYGIRGAGTLRFHLQGLGRLRAARNEAETRRALDDFEVACKTEPEAAVARAGLAAALYKIHLLAGDSTALAKAEASAREAVTLDTRRAEAHHILAQVLRTRRNHREALMEYARAADLGAAEDDVMLLARAYSRVGDLEKERQTYLQAIERRPHSWQPWWWLATWHYRQGNVDESIDAYEQMIRRSPLLNKGYSSLGGLLILRGDYDRAVDTLKKAVELRPTKGAFENLGTAYFNSGRFEDAVQSYNQSFQFGFADYQSWLNLGDAYFWLRDRRDQAAEAYAQAVRLGREENLDRARKGSALDVMIPANLSTVFPKLGQPDSARIFLHEALAADSANTMVQYCAALTHWQLHDEAQALAWLEKSVQGGYPTVWLRDSPIFQEWRRNTRFRALVAAASRESPKAASHN